MLAASAAPDLVHLVAAKQRLLCGRGLKARHKMDAVRRSGRRCGVPPTPAGARLWWDHTVQQIYPGPTQLDDDALIEVYAYPDGAGRPYVRANMVTSLDGAAQGPDGRSGTLSSPADKRVFAMLRGLADVILVGAATARVEKYGRRKRAAHAARRAGLGQLRPRRSPSSVAGSTSTRTVRCSTPAGNGRSC